MIEEDDNVDFLVSTQEVADFTYTLFRYLYYKFEVEHELPKVISPRFRPIIGIGIVHMEKHANKYNNEILERSCFDVPRSILCQKVCNAYPNVPYFNKLYYMSAFILDLMLFLNKHTEATNLTEGPGLWIEIFQKNFDEEFEHHGGWQGFADAGMALLRRRDFPKEALMPDYFMLVMSGLGSLVPTCEETTDVVMEELEESFERLKLSPIKEAGEVEIEKAPIEEAAAIQPEQVGDNPNLPAAVEGGRKRRKRRHDAGPSDSDKESDSVSPSKAKVDRKYLDTTG